MSARPQHFARALTLLEMLISLSLMTLLVGAVSSAVVITSRAVGEGSPSDPQRLSASNALDQMLEEASFALTVTEHTTNALTFTVSDRDGDAADDTIRYSWSGTAGDPLVRQFNADASESVADSVNQFTLSFDTFTSQQTTPGVEQTSPIKQLAVFDAPDITSEVIDPTASISQYVRPTFTRDVISWKVTGVDLKVTPHGPNPLRGNLLIELRTPSDTALPTSELLSTTSVPEKNLPAIPQWKQFTFADSPSLFPGDGVCIVLSDNAGEVTALAPLSTQNSTRSAAWLEDTQALTWTKLTSLSTPYRIYGTTVSRLPDTITPQVILERIDAKLSTTSAPTARGAATTLNHPVLP